MPEPLPGSPSAIARAAPPRTTPSSHGNGTIGRSLEDLTGNLLPGTDPTRYGWLGGKHPSAESPNGGASSSHSRYHGRSHAPVTN